MPTVNLCQPGTAATDTSSFLHRAVREWLSEKSSPDEGRHCRDVLMATPCYDWQNGDILQGHRTSHHGTHGFLAGLSSKCLPCLLSLLGPAFADNPCIAPGTSNRCCHGC